jgi:hypothetical protein
VSSRATFLRRLWQPPARYADRPADRRVTFLELFFDLVFVVVIAQLAHHLAEHVTWSGVGWFVFLFYAVWSSWENGTLYYDLHGTDDVSVRVFTFAQMLAVAVMAMFVGTCPARGRPGSRSATRSTRCCSSCCGSAPACTTPTTGRPRCPTRSAT